MTETRTYPRRDAEGRIASISDLLGVVLAGLLVGVAVLLLFEAVMSVLQLSRFGQASGWLAVLLPAWTFVEEFRAVGYGGRRIVVAILAAGFGVGVGMTVAGAVAQSFPPLVSGAAGAAGTSVFYALIWFYGLRSLRDRAG
ncbi:hypothetical protein [Spirilliplanes yamanashiensis]|uniref:Uncharacterized protein n=1 Tax=Spirilliplanes yamanashiensis TaxID=42233 RepID=A0A8J4DJR2_9ACTN|nr:hypothetical protein [Spirilliplanes yamanashiensis]MDP9815329.1 hypothetical protein [Spirilliplanes yamanashiensis]GIJ03584.1 hypothetical protein Sya03_29360 [Spirilliplanes yamanashiensis]